MSDINKKISVDELAHDLISQEQERLNLGAWANMERMLDGQNPYAKDEGQKKRGFFFFFLGALVISLLSGTAYYFTHSNHKPEIAQNNAATETNNQQKSLASNSTDDVNNNASVNQTSNQTKANQELALNTTTTQSQDEGPIAQNEEATSNYNLQVNQAKAQKNERRKMNTSSKPVDKSDIYNDAQQDEIKDPTNENKLAVNAQRTQEISQVSATTEGSKRAKKAQKNTVTKNKTQAQDIASTNAIENENKKQVSADNEQTNAAQKQLQTIVVQQNKHTGQEDTIAQLYVDKKENKAKQALAAEQSNPRYHPLNDKDEARVNRQLEQPLAQPATDKTQEQKSDATPLLADNSTAVKSKSLPKPESKENKLAERKEQLQNKIDDFRQSRLGSMHLNLKGNTGFYAGVNNNFNIGGTDVGGFNAGVNYMMKLSNNLYFVPHLTYLFKFNNGISLADYNISNPVIAGPTTWFRPDGAEMKIFTSSYDSTATVWNFNRFHSVELPLQIQYEKKRLGLYAGINLAYGFKVKNSVEVPNTYKVTVQDTISVASGNFTPRTNQLYYYSNQDFNSRLGLGYVAGVNYYVTPNVYIDAKLSQNVWNSANQQSAKTISNYFFSSPCLQLTFGYRLQPKEIDIKR